MTYFEWKKAAGFPRHLSVLLPKYPAFQVISTAGHIVEILEEVSIRMRLNDIRTRHVPVLRVKMLKIRGYYTFITAVLGETSLPCNSLTQTIICQYFPGPIDHKKNSTDREHLYFNPVNPS
jgi:hypothetical protein